MAKKKMARRKPETRTVLARLQGNLKTLQRDTEALLRRARKQATQIIPRDQQRSLERLVSQARRIRTDVEKRVRQTAKRVEPRIERFFAALEKQAEKRLERLVVRLVWRMGLVTQKEVRGLSQRIRQLEQRVTRPPMPRRTPAMRTPPSPPAPETAPTTSTES